MDNYLLRYAIDNVWCNPTQDKQFTYALQKLTPRYGIRGNYVVEQTRYFMPTNNNRDYYHIFQIGQVIPANIGLPRTKDTWINLTSLAKDSLTLAHVYPVNGVRYSMSETYVMVTSRQNLLVAVKINDRFPDLENQPIYMHLYHNAFYDSERSGAENRRWLHAESIVAANTEAIRQFQIRNADRIVADGGVGMYFVNGKPVNEISVVTAAPGDHCDFILDPTIKKVVDFKIQDLQTFNSTLDTERKYILHYPGQTDVIDFYDDCTALLVKRGPTPDQFKGLTYHHNKGTWLRQLTHKDYSISVSNIQEFIAMTPEWSGLDDMYVKLYIRDGGYNRPLVADSHRIWELYRLTSAQILQNMTGVNATNPLWRAENLERSYYVQFMSAQPSFVYPITYNDPAINSEGKVEAQNFAAEVFGYHESAKLMNDNPAKVVVDPNTGVRMAQLAFYYWRNATCFEYDDKGVLLEYHYHVGGKVYVPKNPNCAMVECVTGKGSDNLNGYYGNNEVALKYGYNFRVYVTKVWGGVPSSEWQDITDLPNRGDWGYFVDDLYAPKWVWTVPESEWLGYLRTDEYFYLKEFVFNDDPGVIRLAISAWEQQGGQLVNKSMEIPFGQLDTFFNYRPIIQGLDYLIDGELVGIHNLEYREDGLQKVLLRGTGFCSPDMKRYDPAEFGFVEYGVLSNDSEYHIHSHKMQRIIVDGHYKDYRDVVFEEDRNGRVIEGERNGAPYQIQTPQVTLKTVFKDDNKARVEDDLRDQQTSEAMGYYFPKRDRTDPDVFTNHYHVYSAFSNKVVQDMLKGRLKPPFTNGRYTDMDIVNTMKSYEWLQPLDILNHDYNTNHVKVYPHWNSSPIGLTQDQYDFYRRVLKLYLRQDMELSPFFFITGA